MEMTLRWYGPGYDSVTLKQIRQIPGVKNVITTLFGKQAGELLIIILKRCRHWAKRIFIWYVIILCLYLIGREQSLQGYGRTVRRYWHIIRTP